MAQNSEDTNWMDELEQHIVQSLDSSEDTSDPASPLSHDSDDESSDVEDEDMADVDLTPPKPSLPTRTESIPVPTFSPPSPPPPSPEMDEEEEEEEEEEEDVADGPTGDGYTSMHCSAFFTGRHHGYSRSALHTVKEFWSCRQEEWVKINAYNASRAYDGIIKSPRPHLRLDTNFSSSGPTIPALSPSSAVSEDSQESSARTPSPSLDPSLPIFPRVGDIARLRDPRPAMIDRAFCHIPLYSISKIIFAHEISRARSPSSEDGHPDVTAMSVCSDDSTLVDEETSATAGKKGSGAAVEWLERWKVIAEKVGDPAEMEGTQTEDTGDDLFGGDGTALSWADEVQRAHSRPQSPSRKFFFALDDDDFSDRDFDDDDDDYGIELSSGRASLAVGPASGYGWGSEHMSDFEMLF
ncbi:hypothetical protein EIP91_002750 [Steccherinum ochraceum]|uniref:Uncharacterized protein n=1 Tax=Steccherinum ochraceum TaxID=92696 RepID=A0A4R0RE47_9APHY|nr:hypothetical protein EIP91_002750 [Steccherinum ochraceum]